MNKIPAPIDEKNVCTDWIEDIFDNMTCVQCDRQMVGFVNDDPVYAYWSGNQITWRVVGSDDIGKTLKSIKASLKAEFAESDVISELYTINDSIIQKLYF